MHNASLDPMSVYLSFIDCARLNVDLLEVENVKWRGLEETWIQYQFKSFLNV